MVRKRRAIEGASLSFLDVVAGGFGAIILLLVLSKNGQPLLLEHTTKELQGQVASLTEQRQEIRGRTRILNRKLTAAREQLSKDKTRLARLRGDLSSIRGEFKASKQDSAVARIIQKRLATAKQALTEEMQRLLNQSHRRPPSDSKVGGIPVDSEYIIFIIDTSGSMYNYAWRLVLEKLKETLKVYPKVKGIQVMSDMGEYMFSSYRGSWIPDSPARRKAIIQRLATWHPFSNSSPVEGIERAIESFSASDKKISLYVFGDEFTGGSIESVVETVDRLNKKDRQGNRRVRIHAVGFPVQFAQAPRLQTTGIRYATLMRILCERNGGTFVGLPNFRP